MNSSSDTEVQTLEELCKSIQDGDWIETKDQSPNGYRLLQIGNIAPGKFRESGKPRFVSGDTFRRLKCTKIEIGDVLIARMPDPTGRAWCVDVPIPDSITSVDVAIVRVDPTKLDPKYLAYFLNQDSTLRLVSSLQTGSTRQRIKRSDLATLEILTHPLGTQKAIAHVLTNLDEKVAVNEAISKTLEEIAQAIFKSWFIDFDLVKAKMAGEKPGSMNAATAALFPDSMEESELGLIPKGWRVEKFGEMNNLLMGQSPPGDTYNSDGEGLPFYQGRTDFGFRFPKQRIFCTQENRVALSGETLISVRAPVGDVNQAIEKCIIGRGVASAIHKSNSGAYTFSLLKSLYPKLAYFNGEGTVFGAINRSDFNNMLIVEPPTSLVERFEVICGPMNAKIRSLFLSTEALIQLRDSLLPRLISGELQIPEELLVS